ncbi:glucose-1-phosphate cytidylyltransferase [Acetobacter aceti NRIC 0242]|uniref:Glucose-1-phosphate cytidylyltransferase n=2 Tax=Acetobacter aceti TaxID=435 RepID=A0A6S6PPT5_ACEAC|nr:glucose-1-phosphate cytidylyltransferase [Acetobacter aceti]GBO81407.1 glucose-1-phosphate cytidylyltransferase [Acetobacter aceti NRIC 0242]TCS35206.1 glucose-1-phosphate cytidylyltransferase [Acetobacter aceti NBRC 14818]BCI66692.1 glucose-1-phosphate cytidylyltransferase [Acetobacter aceti]BCK75408.1 glucose-1-phosphate cytidylyltransferase [Acetobacter aceti NBRC 14818]GAN57301.1 glucose-1-phosphate cytidylyltransferase [Acetobacter aceti NBRC 14818]
MKVAILAGGFGTRLSEETMIRPKPMAEIGGRPILWHIMKIYSHYGFSDFVILGGYRIDFIRDYFMRYRSSRSDFTIDLGTGDVRWLEAQTDNWRVTILDTGLESLTGGRILRARRYLEDSTFCLTYGDGVSDVNIADLLAFHRSRAAWCTLTAVVQPGRFGALELTDNAMSVSGFGEKRAGDGGLINGGFFVCEPQVLDLIDDDLTTWEAEPMSRLIERGKLSSFVHDRYWQNMDTLRDKQVLEATWATGAAPWKVWSD